jgi:hypothetical protein
MDQTLEILQRARDWVIEDVRVRAALVHGSVVQGTITPLSDVDLIIVAEPGERDAIWAAREQLTGRLLGAPAVAGPLPQLPYRWQARTADLDMLDLTIDEGTVRVWYGFEGPVEFLIDRADVRGEFERAMAGQPSPVAHDAAAECDATWGQFAKLVALLLHHRTLATRIGLNELITARLLPLLDRSSYVIGTVHDQHDRDLTARLDQVYPASGDAAELRRAIRTTADWYAELLTAWSDRTGRPRPTSALERGVFNALDRLVE